MTPLRLQLVYLFLLLGSTAPTQSAVADDFVLVQAEDPKVCSVEGRVETHKYPRSVGRQMAMLHPGSRLTLVTEMRNVSIILPPVFESPGPRYGNFLASRLRVRVDDQTWRELALATARAETIIAENLPAGKHTITVEPVGGLAVVDAFRLSNQALAGFYGTIVASEYSELLTDVRMDIFQGQRLVRTEYVRHPRTGDFEIFALPAGDYRVQITAAGWQPEVIESVKIKAAGHRVDAGTIILKREPRSGGGDAQDRPSPRFGHTLCATPGGTITALVNLPALTIKRAQLQSKFKSVDLTVMSIRKLPIGRWNDVGEATFQLPKNIPWDMYDLVLTFDTKQGEVQRISGQAVCVRPPLPEQYHIAGCGHMNTWGQQTAEYLARVAQVAELAGARTLLIANEVNAAYISGSLADLRIPYVVTGGNHTMPRWHEFFGSSSRAHDDGPMRVVDYSRWPYESWSEVETLFRGAPKATNRIIVCYESFAPISLIRDQNIKLLFDAHTDDPHADRKDFPPRTFHMRAPTQETLRWIPMTHQGIDPAVKSNADVPVLAIPRTGPSPLRVTFEVPNDGTANEQIATITNDYATEFPHARLRLVLRRGVCRITGATVLQSFDADDAMRTVFDLDVRVSGKSAVVIRAKSIGMQ